MRISNHHDLPEAYWKANAFQRARVPNRISVTELLKPPQMRALERLHQADLEVDCADMVETFFGSAVHQHLAAYSSQWAEQPIEWTDPVSGWTVRGTPDLVEHGTLIDWKTTRVRALQYDREEWEQQTNLYAHLHRLAGEWAVAEIAVWAFCKDWDPQKRREEGYPTSAIVKIPMPLWGADEAHAFLLRRLGLHIAAEQGQYGPCTDEERWMRHSWAVFARGRDGRAKRAGFRTPDEAWAYALASVEPPQRVEDWYDVELREGEPVRCLAWCPVREVCGQWAEDQARRDGSLAEQLRASIHLVAGE